MAVLFRIIDVYLIEVKDNVVSTIVSHITCLLRACLISLSETSQFPSDPIGFQVINFSQLDGVWYLGTWYEGWE
jgi:hypothetical protein